MGQSLLTSSGASDCPYNVGDIYITTLNTNPQDIWKNTTLEKVKDRFLLSSGDTYTLGAIGGEAAHTLTIAEMPKHDHNLYYDYEAEHHDKEKHAFRNSSGAFSATNMYYTMPNAVDTSGYDNPHNNMPPYLCVNMWIRKE